jgi:hypothetical protein
VRGCVERWSIFNRTQIVKVVVFWRFDDLAFGRFDVLTIWRFSILDDLAI